MGSKIVVSLDRRAHLKTMISHTHQCVFVHIPKCGGTSIEQAFVEDLGLAWSDRAPLLLRPRVRSERAPLALAHLTASDYVQNFYLSPELFDRYFKFTTVRDPLARSRSAYRYLGASHVMSFDVFVDRHLRAAVLDPSHRWHWFLRPQTDFLCSGDTMLVDEVIKLESLNELWPGVAARLGLRNQAALHENQARQKGTVAKLRSTVRGSLNFSAVPRWGTGSASISDQARAAVAEIFRRDYDLLDYPL